MGPRSYTIVGASIAGVAATLVAASLPTTSIFGEQHAGRPDVQPITVPRRPGVVVRADDGGLPTWLTVGMTVLLALYALALLVLVIWRKRGREEAEERMAPDEEEATPSDHWRVVLPVDLASAIQEQLAALHLGTPRNAIVACWLSLRTATVRAGMPEVPSETSEEYLVRALDSLVLDPPAIRTLAALYREARFSEHLMTEGQRQLAGRELRVLADHLTRAHPDPAADPAMEGLSR